MKKIFLILSFILLSTGLAHALGTTANVIITSPSANYTVDYKDSNMIDQTTAHPTTPLNSTPVTAIYGLVSAVAPSEVTRSVRAGYGIVSPISQQIRSRSNPALGVTINFSNLSFVQKVATIGNAGNWSIASNVAFRKNIYFNQTGSFTLSATADAQAHYASVATVTVNYFLSGHQPSHVVNYTGFNAQPYGGLGTVPVLLTFTVQGPNMVVLNSTKAVQAPAGLTGAVPGAKITYQNILQNSGDATANAIVIDQVIPTHTTFFGIPSGGTQDSTQYKISGVFGVFSAPSSNVQAVRFNKTEVGPGKIVTVNFTVTVN